MRLAVNYYLLRDLRHHPRSNRAWYLFSATRKTVGLLVERPPPRWLGGHIGPELFMKLPNSVAIVAGELGLPDHSGLLLGTQNSEPE